MYNMKKLLSLLFVLFAVVSIYAAEPDSLLLAGDSFRNPINREDCTFKGIPLHGKIKIVNCCADFKVEIVNCCADIDVEVVNCCGDRCGQWQFVNSGEDFTIEIVNCCGDFKARFVNCCAGIP